MSGLFQFKNCLVILAWKSWTCKTAYNYGLILKGWLSIMRYCSGLVYRPRWYQHDHVDSGSIRLNSNKESHFTTLHVQISTKYLWPYSNTFCSGFGMELECIQLPWLDRSVTINTFSMQYTKAGKNAICQKYDFFKTDIFLGKRQKYPSKWSIFSQRFPSKSTISQEWGSTFFSMQWQCIRFNGEFSFDPIAH